MKRLHKGAHIWRRWGGFKIGYPAGTPEHGSQISASILPKLVSDMEAAGKIVRVDDRTSGVGEEWALVTE
jgi:hypothetical protein